MPRPARIDPPDGLHHVMNRGTNRGDVFFTDHDRIDFETLLGEIHDLFGVETVAYCLMTNHYHLMLHCPDGGLSEAMKHLGSVFTRHVNDRTGRDGPLFRGRFHSILIETALYEWYVARYIHRNPLDLPGITHPSQYRWSSHRMYLSARVVPDHVNPSRILDTFDSPEAFDRFVSGTDPFGSAARPGGPQSMSIDASTIRSLVWFRIAETTDDDRAAWISPSTERTVLRLVFDEIGRSIAAELPLEFASTSAAADRRALQRARQRSVDDPFVRMIAERVAADIGSGRLSFVA